MKQTTIYCLKCNAPLDLDDVLLAHRDRIAKEVQQNHDRQVAAQKSELEQREEALKIKTAEVDKEIAEKTQAAIARREKELIKEATEKAKKTLEVDIQSKADENAELKKQLQASRTTQLENEELKRKIADQEHAEKLERAKLLQENDAQNRKKFDELLKTETANITKQEAERNERQLAEIQKQLADAKKAAEDAVRKAEQGSQQLQGEVQELAIEDFLKAAFPSDIIEEIPKGKRGADVKQTVRNQFNAELGIIVYESKDTKNWGNDWIDKLKSDKALVKGDVAVLVTTTMPKEMEHFGLKDGVWVCRVSEFKGLATVLRESLVRLSEVRMAQTNKGEKMQMLYDYLTDERFAELIKRVLSGFITLREDYRKEKETMQRIWAKRDKQLETLSLNTNEFYGQIQAIAGASLPRLESPEDELLALGSETE